MRKVQNTNLNRASSIQNEGGMREKKNSDKVSKIRTTKKWKKKLFQTNPKQNEHELDLKNSFQTQIYND